MKVWLAAVGAPQAAQISLVKALEASSRAAARPGPKVGMPPARRTSATPSASGASGPIITKSTSFSRAKAEHLVAVEDVERDAGRLLGDAGVAGRAPEPVAFRVLREGPGQRVLAAAAAEDEDVHGELHRVRGRLLGRVAGMRKARARGVRGRSGERAR